MYYNTIDEKRRKVLENIVKNIELNDYYMAGGTALSLQCGNRISYDFDFFVREKFNVDEIKKRLEKLGEIKIIYSKERYITLYIRWCSSNIFILSQSYYR